MNRRIYKQNKGHAIAEEAMHHNGIYGEIGQTLNANDALAIGCTLGTMLKTKDQCLVIVGTDNRATSEVLETEMCRGLAATGCYVMRAGITPTPAIEFCAHCLGASSVMITGGGDHHDVNGFKMAVDQIPLSEERIERLAALSANGSWYKDRGGALEGNILEMYRKKLQQICKTTQPLKIAWDLCGGTACNIIPELSDEIAGEHLMMNDELDPQFNLILPDCRDEKRITLLREVVLGEKCDIGIICNADCSQMSVMDSEGQIWPSDKVFNFICKHYLDKKLDRTVLVNIDCPASVKLTIEKFGGKLTYCPSGLSPLIEAIKAEKGHIAYHSDGNCLFGANFNYVPASDALFSVITLLNNLSQTENPLASYYKRIDENHSSPRRYFDHTDSDSVILAIRKRLLMNQIQFNDIEGIRVDHERGYWRIFITKTATGKKLALDISATEQDILPLLYKEFLQYLDLISKEVASPKEMIPSKEDILETDRAKLQSARERALKVISDDDREVIEFVSKHWNSIRKSNSVPNIEPSKERPKRPWKR